MNPHGFKLAIGLSILGICGGAASAQEARLQKSVDAREEVVETSRPIPMPVVNPATMPRHTGPVALKRKDLRTGQVTEIPLSEAGASIPEAVLSLLRDGHAEQFFTKVDESLAASGESPANQGVAEFGGEVMLGRAFGARTLVTTPSAYPNSYNCRISMCFGSACGWMGSATLVDPKWVLTAGHCVYTSSPAPAGAPANTWASNFTVAPAYDNGANAGFGTARAIALWTYTAWTNSRDFNYDIAFAELDRPIGALTGWAGYGFDNSQAFFDNNVFRLCGYPAAGGYNGQRMYTRSGDFNNRSGNIIFFNPGGLGGESGSSYTRSNIAYAVHSHSYSSSLGGGVALWSQAFYDLRDARILAGTPVAADLIPLAVRTTTTSKNRGGVISSVQVLLHNYSRSTFSGTPILSTRFSSNDLITTLDPQGSVHSAGYMTIAPKQSRWVTLSNVVVPTTSPTGSIFLGIIINNADANTGNNATSAQDTRPIFIY